jgi:hypothetical protein
MIFLNCSDIRVWEHYQNDFDLAAGFVKPRELPARSLEYSSKLFNSIGGNTIVECGTGLQGEMSGNSMLYWFHKTTAGVIHCIDMDPQWIDTVRRELGATDRVVYHHEDCFRIVPDIADIDLIYMDFWVADGYGREKAYIDLYNISRFPKMILVDDTDHSRPWKQTMIVPVAVVSHGYKLIYMGRQTLLVRKDIADTYSHELLSLRPILS